MVAVVQVERVIHRAAPLLNLPVVLLQAEVLHVHEPQHLVQPAAQGAAITEAAHQEAQVRGQAPQHDSGKLPPIAPGLHRIIHQREVQPAVNNGK